jgi:hypothetical protein
MLITWNFKKIQCPNQVGMKILKYQDQYWFQYQYEAGKKGSDTDMFKLSTIQYWGSSTQTAAILQQAFRLHKKLTHHSALVLAHWIIAGSHE